MERFTNRLKETDVGELFDDAQQFARRNPAMFIGSAFALGLVAARFLKSSGNRNGQATGSRTQQSARRDPPSASVTREPNFEGSAGEGRL
jgi:hypothetical protein